MKLNTHPELNIAHKREKLFLMSLLYINVSFICQTIVHDQVSINNTDGMELPLLFHVAHLGPLIGGSIKTKDSVINFIKVVIFST